MSPCLTCRGTLGLGLSLLFHALLLLLVLERQPEPVKETGDTPDAPLAVRLIPPSVASGSPAAAPRSPPEKAVRPERLARREKPVARKKPTPPVPDRAAVERPLSTTPAPPPSAPDTAAAPVDMMDMLSAARARRRAAGIQEPTDSAGDSPKPAHDDNAIARANVEYALQAQSRGRNDGGGVFQITYKSTRAAGLIFRGWDVRRRSTTRQFLEIEAGPDGDIDTAIVRKMIELIRRYETEDFNWDSHRLGRVVVLSARLRDTAELEAYLKKDFFDSYP